MVRGSIIMEALSRIGPGTVIDKAIIAENVTVGSNVVMGAGEEALNVLETGSPTASGS